MLVIILQNFFREGGAKVIAFAEYECDNECGWIGMKRVFNL
jgi:hypothetical protein